MSCVAGVTSAVLNSKFRLIGVFCSSFERGNGRCGRDQKRAKVLGRRLGEQVSLYDLYFGSPNCPLTILNHQYGFPAFAGTGVIDAE